MPHRISGVILGAAGWSGARRVSRVVATLSAVLWLGAVAHAESVDGHSIPARTFSFAP